MSRALVGAGLIATVMALPSPAQNGFRGDDPTGAARYFVELRVGPNATIPSGARAAALAQMRARWPQLIAPRDATLSTVPALDPTRTWVPLGPRPITGSGLANSGRLNSIAIHPTNSSIIYVGGAQGGVWKTTDGGGAWTPLTDNQCSLAMGSIALDPVNPEIVYVGTGEQNFSGDSYYGCGVLKSVNGGQTWSEVGRSVITSNGTRRPRISRVVVDKFTANTANTLVLVATDAGLFRSLDAGTTWVPGVTEPLGAVTDLVADPVNQGVFYAANGDIGGSARNGVYKTIDGGTTWTKTTMPSAGGGRISLAVAPSAPTTVYAAVHAANNGGSNANALLGIWQTTDGGATWSQKHGANQTLCAKQCWYDMVIAVDPTDPATLYFGGFSLSKSTNSGATFTDIGTSIHVDHHTFAFDPTTPTTIYAGSDGGIFKSTSGGISWTSLNTNLELTQFYGGVSVSPTSQTTILGGTQDNGTLEWGGLGSWPQVAGGDGGFTALDQLTGGTAFAETQWTPNSGFSGPRRRDAGAGQTQFLLKIAGINTADSALFIPPLVMDPLRPRIVYFGTSNLYRTDNSGDQWASLGRIGAGNARISSIGPAPSDTMTIYAGSTDGRLTYTHDLGATWTVASGTGVGPVTDIAVDPRDARTAIIVHSNFTAGGKVFRTTDGGVTWTNLTFNLPSIPVLAVVLEPGSRDITIGTDLGVFTLPNGASAWTPILNGLPTIAVYDLVFDAPRSRLIAATHGRGMFSLDVTVTGLRGDVAGPGDTAPDGVLGALDAQVILAMAVGNTPPAGSQRYPNGDANCDGQVTALDAMIVLRKAAGLTDPGVCVGTIK